MRRFHSRTTLAHTPDLSASRRHEIPDWIPPLMPLAQTFVRACRATSRPLLTVTAAPSEIENVSPSQLSPRRTTTLSPSLIAFTGIQWLPTSKTDLGKRSAVGAADDSTRSWSLSGFHSLNGMRNSILPTAPSSRQSKMISESTSKPRLQGPSESQIQVRRSTSGSTRGTGGPGPRAGSSNSTSSPPSRFTSTAPTAQGAPSRQRARACRAFLPQVPPKFSAVSPSIPLHVLNPSTWKQLEGSKL